MASGVGVAGSGVAGSGVTGRGVAGRGVAGRGVAVVRAVAWLVGAAVVSGPAVWLGALEADAMPLEPGSVPLPTPAVADAPGDHGTDASQEGMLPSAVEPEPGGGATAPEPEPEPLEGEHAPNATASTSAQAAAATVGEPRRVRTLRYYEPSHAFDPRRTSRPQQPSVHGAPAALGGGASRSAGRG